MDVSASMGVSMDVSVSMGVSMDVSRDTELLSSSKLCTKDTWFTSLFMDIKDVPNFELQTPKNVRNVRTQNFELPTTNFS